MARDKKKADSKPNAFYIGSTTSETRHSNHGHSVSQVLMCPMLEGIGHLVAALASVHINFKFDLKMIKSDKWVPHVLIADK